MDFKCETILALVKIGGRHEPHSKTVHPVVKNGLESPIDLLTNFIERCAINRGARDAASRTLQVRVRF